MYKVKQCEPWGKYYHIIYCNWLPSHSNLDQESGWQTLTCHPCDKHRAQTAHGHKCVNYAAISCGVLSVGCYPWGVGEMGVVKKIWVESIKAMNVLPDHLD